MTHFNFFFNEQMQKALKNTSSVDRQLTGYDSIDSLGGFVYGLNVVVVENTDEIEMFILNSPYLVDVYPYLQRIVESSAVLMGNVVVVNAIDVHLGDLENISKKSKEFINIVFVGRNKTKGRKATVNDIKGTSEWAQVAAVVVIAEIRKRDSYHNNVLEITIPKHKNSKCPEQPEIIDIEKYYNPKD